jgi:hypothetical protein
MTTRNRHSAHALVLLAAALVAVPALRADDAGGEEKLRSSLRDTMLQLRQAQSDLSSAQAAQATQADEEKQLKDQLALMTKHSAEDRAASDKVSAAAKAKEAEEAGEIKRLNGLLTEWKAAGEKMNQAIKDESAAKVKAQGDSAMLERRVEDLKAKNAELYRVGLEILGRYKKFTLGEQFEAREPFIGRTRVYLENLMQDYEDQLQAQKAKPQS